MEKSEVDAFRKFFWKTVRHCNLKDYLNERSNLGGSSETNVRQQMKRNINELERLFNKSKNIFGCPIKFREIQIEKFQEAGLKPHEYKIYFSKRYHY